MFATAVAAVGAISSGVGIFNSISGGRRSRRAARAQADTQRQIAIERNKAEELNFRSGLRVGEIQRKQEFLRKQQLGIQAFRERRAIARNAQIARSAALNRAANTGAQQSSILTGAFGQIQGDSSYQQSVIQDNLRAAGQMFNLNTDIYNERRRNAFAVSDINKRLGFLGSEAARYEGDFRSGQSQTQFGNTLFGTGVNLFGNAQQYGQTIGQISTGNF